MNKEKIKRSFTRSFHTYDDNAEMQKKICSNLASLINTNMNLNSKTVFEIGCGTGLLSSRICKLSCPSGYFANDLVADSKDALASIFKENPSMKWEFLEGDAEEISFPSSIDLLTSSSVVQWFHDFDSFVKKAHEAISKDGLLAFSSFGNDNYKEIKHLLGVGLNYFSKKELENKLSSHFELIYIEESTKKLYFSSAKEVLYHMKNTGVTGNSDLKWTSKSLVDFEDEYALSFRNSDGMYELTYQPITVIARKKNI